MWWFVPAENVKRIILSSPNKSCHSYPTPTDIVKECIDQLLPAISSMVNLSLDTGQIQDIWKKALVRSTEKGLSHSQKISHSSPKWPKK